MTIITNHHPAAGNKPERIEEFIGQANSSTAAGSSFEMLFDEDQRLSNPT